MRILLIDDDPTFRSTLSTALREHGHKLVVAADGNEGMRQLRAAAFELVIADVHHPGPDGFTILQYARKTSPQSDIVLMTRRAAVADAVAAIKQRAADYLVKPLAIEDMVARVARIADRRLLNSALRAPDPECAPVASRLVGASASMAHVRTQIRAMGNSTASVLITGESGTGKELVARALHENSPARNGPFVAINCAAFPETLLEAELFGYARGAFTGADRKREGRFSAAKGGTVFLDEVSEMQPACQAKLLRVLQEREFSPLGTNSIVALDVRVLSATNRSLKQLTCDRRFRSDLLYRIKVLDIKLPPLRERHGDLALLVAHFLRKFVGDGEALALASETWALLSEYSFPGNVRELEHALEHAVVLGRASGYFEIRPEHLPTEIPEATRATTLAEGTAPFCRLPDAMHAFERTYLLRALSRCAGNKTHAARLLGISRKNLWEKMRSRGISDADIEADIEAFPGEALPAEAAPVMRS